METKDNNSNNVSAENLPDFKQAGKKALVNRILILMVLVILIVSIGYAFGMDLTAWAKLLRFLR